MARNTKSARPKRTPTGEYEVGYARPPTDTQFKRGVSGNPKGRPRRSRNKVTLLKQSITTTLEETVQVKIGGEVRTMTMAEALGASAVVRAAKSGKT